MKIKRKLAALNKENHEESPRSNHVRDTNVPRTQEDFITQVSEETEGRVTKKLSQEFSRTETRILGDLSRLDVFLLNPLIQGHSGFVPETSRNTHGENQGTNEDRSQNDPHPKVRALLSQSSQDCCPDDTYESTEPQKIFLTVNHLHFWRPDLRARLWEEREVTFCIVNVAQLMTHTLL